MLAGRHSLQCPLPTPSGGVAGVLLGVLRQCREAGVCGHVLEGMARLTEEVAGGREEEEVEVRGNLRSILFRHAMNESDPDLLVQVRQRQGNNEVCIVISSIRFLATLSPHQEQLSISMR